LECARPGMAVFQRMLRSAPAPGSAFHDVATFPSATPPASGPRNEGQLTVAAPAAAASMTPSRVRLITSIEYNTVGQPFLAARAWAFHDPMKRDMMGERC